MTFLLADRVRETCTSEGLFDFTLDGAVSGFQSFSSAIGNGNKTYYLATFGTEWEIGVGTVVVGAVTTLTRDVVLASSNGGNKVDFGSGTKDVRCILPADKFVYLDDQSLVSISGILALLHATTGEMRIRSSRTDTGTIGKITALATNDADSEVTFGSLLFNTTDRAAGSEDGTITWQTRRQGSLATRGYFKNGLVVGSPAGDDKGDGTINAKALYVDGRAVAPSGTYPDQVYLVRNARWADADPLRVSADTYLNGTHRGRLIYADAGVTIYLPRLSPATGTAQSGSSTTITLDSGQSSVDDRFNGFEITITGGTGLGQTRNIVDYEGATKLCTVDRAWDVVPDNTSQYSIDLGGDIVLAFLNIHASANVTLSPASGDAADVTKVRPSDTVILCGDRAGQRWREMTNRRETHRGTPLEISPYAQGWYTGTHGLSKTPDWFTVELVCLTAELNYSAGHILPITSFQSQADVDDAIQIVSNWSSTEIGVYVKGTVKVPNRSTGALTTITPANWKLCIVPFAVET